MVVSSGLSGWHGSIFLVGHRHGCNHMTSGVSESLGFRVHRPSGVQTYKGFPEFGYLFGGHYNKDYGILGVYIGVLI